MLVFQSAAEVAVFQRLLKGKLLPFPRVRVVDKKCLGTAGREVELAVVLIPYKGAVVLAVRRIAEIQQQLNLPRSPVPAAELVEAGCQKVAVHLVVNMGTHLQGGTLRYRRLPPEQPVTCKENGLAGVAEQAGHGGGALSQIGIRDGYGHLHIRCGVQDADFIVDKLLLQLHITRVKLRPDGLYAGFHQRMGTPDQHYIIPLAEDRKDIGHLLLETLPLLQNPGNAGIVENGLTISDMIQPLLRHPGMFLAVKNPVYFWGSQRQDFLLGQEILKIGLLPLFDFGEAHGGNLHMLLLHHHEVHVFVGRKVNVQFWPAAAHHKIGDVNLHIRAIL